MNFKNKKVVIMGLGSYKNGSGISSALYFLKKGVKLLITDLKTKKELTPQINRLKKFPHIEYILGKHRPQDFKNADFIFKNPSVPKDSPYLQIARKNKIPIINDWTFFFEERPNNLVIGITGTKGKSTTTALLHHLLKNTREDVALCGNIGQSPLAILNKIKKNTIVVAELSSWLLHDFRKSPQISIITNLMPDHLDKYKNLRDYYDDKKNIFRFQDKQDYLILNRNYKNLKKLAKTAKSQIIWYDGEPKNAALVVAKILKIPERVAKKAIKNFKGLADRIELVRNKNGIRYINDTTATTPDATIYALHQLGKNYPERNRKIILIAGGVDKKLDYKKLAHEIGKYCKALILFEGTASDKIKYQISKIKIINKKLKIKENVSSMNEALKLAQDIAEKGGIILLSPGAASFNLFKNEFDRGNQFVKCVKHSK